MANRNCENIKVIIHLQNFLKLDPDRGEDDAVLHPEKRDYGHQGVDFTNILRAVFTQKYYKSAKTHG